MRPICSMERVIQPRGIPGVNRLPLEAPGGLGTLAWPWRLLSTEREGRGTFCTMEKPEEGRG